MSVTVWKRSGLRGARVALLLACTAVVGGAPMLAQDEPPAPPAGSQQGPPPGGGGRDREQRQLEMMTQRLGLTADQVTSIKAIDAEMRQQAMAMREDTSTSREQRRDQMMSLMKTRDAKIREVLTEEQKPKYDAMLAQMRERREQRPSQDGQSAPSAPPAPQL